MTGDDDIRKAISDGGWRQGTLIPNELKPRILEQSAGHLTAIDWIVVITQDCDLLNHDLIKEPWVEMLSGKTVESADKAKMYGHNPRLLQLVEQVEGKNVIMEFSIHDRFRISRKILLSCQADSKLALCAANTRLLVRWVAKRYTRPAFPDAFNERLRPKEKHIRNILSKNWELWSGLYLRVVPLEEVSPETKYRVIIRATVPLGKDHEANEPRIIEAQEKLGFLESYIQECEGIEVEACQALSENQFPISDLTLFSKWDYDYISYQHDQGDSLLPEE